MNTQEKLQSALSFIKDIAEHGCRHDTNPTMILNRGEDYAHMFWHNWCESMDKSVKDRAKQFLNQLKEE